MFKSNLRQLICTVLLVACYQTQGVSGGATFALAAAAPASGQADWQQWDGFLTFITKRFGRDLTGDSRENLTEIFLDARYDLVRALAPSEASSQDPVPGLFLSTMTRLSPLLRQAALKVPSSSATQFSSFASAVDKLTFLGGLGLQLGFTRITPDMLRGLARIAEPAAAVDPLVYNLDFDQSLREILGFGVPLASPRPSSLLEQSRFHNLPGSAWPIQRTSTMSGVIKTAVSAAEPETNRLNQWVPDREELKEYLSEVRELLSVLANETLEKSKLASEYHPLYKNVVFAAAWQESCWRQFIRKGEKLTPLSSVTGDVGMMQINRRVWRGVYDVGGLGGDIEYNGRAGAEILLNYLTRYAIRKSEDKQPGGVSNLARATYSAYNGGPSHLTRYRAPKPNPTLKKVDDLFWKKYQAASSGHEMDVLQCYGQ